MRLPVKVTVLAAHVEGSLYLQDEGLTHWIRKKNSVALAGITKIHDFQGINHPCFIGVASSKM